MYISTWIIILGIIIFFLYSRIKKKRGEFTPFYVKIEPNWYKLLKDYELIDDKGWRELMGKFPKNTPGRYNVIRDGIVFTLLESKENRDLIYWNNTNSFHTEVDFRAIIEELEKPIDKEGFQYTPEFYVKWGIEGYEIGITTPESSKEIVMMGDNNELVKIATLPYAVFNMPKYRFGIIKADKRKEYLQKFGWKEEIQDIEMELAGWPMELKNEYFNIYYKYI